MNAFPLTVEKLGSMQNVCSSDSSNIIVKGFVLLFMLLLGFPSFGQAVDPVTSEVNLPQDIPPLPDPQRPEERLFITRENVALFHELLMAPLAAWVKEKKMVMSVVSHTNFRWTYSRAWMEASVAQVGKFDLDADHNLVALSGQPAQGFPFGDAEDINNEADSARRAYKILWNISYAEASSGDVLYGTNLYWVGTQALLRKSVGQFYRRFSLEPNVITSSVPATAHSPQKMSPSSVSVSAKNIDIQQTVPLQPAVADLQSPPLFGAKWDIFRRDVLQLVSPPVVFGYATIGWRYRGTDDDALWMYSPVIERRRQLLDSNRSDSLLGGALTLDDLFVWSGKTQGVDARVVEDKILFVPFPALSPYALVDEEISRKLSPVPNESSLSSTSSVSSLTPSPVPAPKVEISDAHVEYEKTKAVNGLFEGSDQKPETMLWNFTNKKFLNFAPWLPTEVRFVPRRVWILELSPRDPFYQSGRQILVVDQESMLPVYKVVYNRHGGYQRTIVGGWGLAATEDGSIRFPFSAYVLAVEQGFDPAVCVSHNYVRTFLGKRTKLSSDLDNLLHIEAHGRKEGSNKENTQQLSSTSKAPSMGAQSDDSSENSVRQRELAVDTEGEGAADESGPAVSDETLDSEAGVDFPDGQDGEERGEEGPSAGNTQKKIWDPA